VPLEAALYNALEAVVFPSQISCVPYLLEQVRHFLQEEKVINVKMARVVTIVFMIQRYTQFNL